MWQQPRPPHEHGLKMDAPTILDIDDPVYCHRCEIVVPRKTRHCRLCDKCVEQFDHHCTFLNMCIGKANHRWFRWLLSSAWLLLTLQGTVSIVALTQPRRRSSWSSSQIGLFVGMMLMPTIGWIFMSALAMFHGYLYIHQESTYAFISRRAQERQRHSRKRSDDDPSKPPWPLNNNNNNQSSASGITDVTLNPIPNVSSL